MTAFALFPPILAAVAVCLASARAQCGLQVPAWVGHAGADDFVGAMHVWDSDGPGPQPPVLVVGGGFQVIGSTAVSRIAARDLGTGQWSAIGGGINSTVSALTSTANGDLVAAGDFTMAGTAPANGIARWNGSMWAPFGAGLTGGAVTELFVMPSGDLIAGGTFTTAGGVAASRIARWDGVAWSAVGAGLPSTPRAFALAPNGDLLAGGPFGLRRLVGSAWTTVLTDVVTALGNGPNGLVYVGREYPVFLSPFSVVWRNRIDAWDGATWTQLPFSGNDLARVFDWTPNGDLVAIGAFGTTNVAIWNGTSWSSLGTGTYPTENLHSGAVLPNGDVAVGGYIDSAGGVGARNLALWSGSTWQAMAAGFDREVLSLARATNGDLLIGGAFTSCGSTAIRGVARWNGSAWSGFGTGVLGNVFALTMRPNGDVIAGGQIGSAGGVPSGDLVRWDGAAWSGLGAPNGWVFCLANLPNGDLVVGGAFTAIGGIGANRIARWNGTTWSPLGIGLDGTASALHVAANGDLFVFGDFTTAGGIVVNRTARWNGSTWAPLGVGTDGSVLSAAAMADGSLVVGGSFTQAGGAPASGVARWDGSAWTPLGSGIANFGVHSVSSLLVLPGGDLLAGGLFGTAGGAPARNLARWNGTSWSQVGSGANRRVWAMLLAPDHIVLSGGFTLLDGAVAGQLARLEPSCPASVGGLGTGCTGSGGPNVLTAVGRPWLGATFAATASGLAPGLAVRVVGLSALPTPQPLPAVLPEGVAGCALWVAPDLLSVHVPTAGTVATTLPIPANPVLNGIAVYDQVASLEFDLTGTLIAATTTNALVLTIGSM